MSRKQGRPQTSDHGKLFGGDSLYEVLAELAARRRATFSVTPTADRKVVALAEAAQRTPAQIRREVRKLQSLGVLKEVERRRKTELFAVTESEISRTVLSLPKLLVAQLGAYRREPAS
jgi:predicted transcriptional regulator